MCSVFGLIHNSPQISKVNLKLGHKERFKCLLKLPLHCTGLHNYVTELHLWDQDGLVGKYVSLGNFTMSVSIVLAVSSGMASLHRNKRHQILEDMVQFTMVHKTCNFPDRPTPWLLYCSRSGPCKPKILISSSPYTFHEKGKNIYVHS